MEYRWVDTDEDLADVVAEVAAQPRYAMDTEFHRERTYYPRLALVQLAWEGGMALIDPLACEPKGLAPLLTSPSLAVLHAAQQDLDVLTTACGVIPAQLFDTQLAAGFLGYSTPSLVSLLQGELKVQLPKGDRLTDWLRRPLTEAQRDYAASDVAHLLELADTLQAQLLEMGRSEWASAACEELRTRAVGHADPGDAWLKLKDVRALRPKSRGVAKAVAEWRERRAMATDTPPRQVLPDLAILGIAQKVPVDINELSQARGVDERHRRGAIGRELLSAVERGVREPADAPTADVDDLDRSLRPAVPLVSAWVSEVARRERIDTALLATRQDLVALLRGDPDARLAEGWRGELLGDDIRGLVGGRVGLTFDGSGHLRLYPVGG
jgi:ribonuclease D